MVFRAEQGGEGSPAGQGRPGERASCRGVCKGFKTNGFQGAAAGSAGDPEGKAIPQNPAL